MDGYRLAKALGHHRTALYPALVQIRTDPAYPRALKRRKGGGAADAAPGRGTVLAARKGSCCSPSTASAARRCSTCRGGACGGEGLTLALDLPERWEAEVPTAAAAAETSPALPGEPGVGGLLHTRLGQMALQGRRVPAGTAADLTDSDLERVARQAMHFALPIDGGTCGFDQAQVTAGGLCTDEFDPETMESRFVSRAVCLRRAAGRGRRLRRVQLAVGLPPGGWQGGCGDMMRIAFFTFLGLTGI